MHTVPLICSPKRLLTFIVVESFIYDELHDGISARSRKKLSFKS
jgi:hypothetical protein